MKKYLNVFAPLLLALSLLLNGCSSAVNDDLTGLPNTAKPYAETAAPVSIVDPSPSPAGTVSAVPSESVPEYSGQAYTPVNNNIPYFTDADMSSEPFESYSELDDLGRCGAAFACISPALMPTEERGSIGQVKPTGWHTVKYDIVDGKYLYNRCHLIGYQLTAENANTRNLITGTRYMNTEGMLPFENMVADYIDETGNRVLYRVTPVFKGNNLVADGVLMEALSVEDNGAGISYNVFVYNVQPGILIDYATGESRFSESAAAKQEETEEPSQAARDTLSETRTYILNTNTKKFHIPPCHSVDSMKDKNKKEYTGDREDIISQGYSPCKNCNP